MKWFDATDFLCELPAAALSVDLGRRFNTSYTYKEKAAHADGFFFGRRTDPLNEPVLNTLHSLLLNFPSIQSRLKSLNLALESLRAKPTTDLRFLL